MLILILLIFLGGFIFLLPKYLIFRGSAYQKASGNAFMKTLFDKGNYGEYLTFSKLEKLPGYNRLLTNVYLPKNDGSTTEVDLIMLAESGLYVFESKNYSGWIFGDEKSKNWMQTLPNKQKTRFYNPIWQNKTHINALRSVLEIADDKLLKSYIIFSERCALKKINVTSPNVKVMKRDALLSTINKEIGQRHTLLTNEDIDRLYFKLQRYSHADATVKEEHIKQIQQKRMNH